MGLATDLGLGCYELSSPVSKVRALIVPTDEELMIARDTLRVLQRHLFPDEADETSRVRTTRIF